MLKTTIAFAGALLVAGIASAQTANPIAQALASLMTDHQKNMVSAAEAMPEDKYGFKPTPESNSFADLVAHSANANFRLCSLLAGEKAPEATVKAGGTKQALVDQMKQSFTYCEQAFPKFDPASLGEEVQFMNRKATKAWVALMTSLDWGDHYAQIAMRLRLNGIIPPSAQKK